ncbi:hypothetical protein D3C86_1400430 [compost metagenome]
MRRSGAVSPTTPVLKAHAYRRKDRRHLHEPLRGTPRQHLHRPATGHRAVPAGVRRLGLQRHDQPAAGAPEDRRAGRLPALRRCPQRRGLARGAGRRARAHAGQERRAVRRHARAGGGRSVHRLAHRRCPRLHGQPAEAVHLRPLPAHREPDEGARDARLPRRGAQRLQQRAGPPAARHQRAAGRPQRLADGNPAAVRGDDPRQLRGHRPVPRAGHRHRLRALQRRADEHLRPRLQRDHLRADRRRHRRPRGDHPQGVPPQQRRPEPGRRRQGGDHRPHQLRRRRPAVQPRHGSDPPARRAHPASRRHRTAHQERLRAAARRHPDQPGLLQRAALR